MPPRTAAALAAALVMVLVAVAVRASWDGAASAGDGTAGTTSTDAGAETTVPPSMTATTEGATVTFPGSPSTSTTAAPPATSAPATTVDASSDGLPSSLALPGADVISLSGGSVYSSAFTVTGVPGPEVVEWLVGELAADGWDVDAPVAGVISFSGPNAVGVALVGGDGPVAVAIRLTAP